MVNVSNTSCQLICVTLLFYRRAMCSDLVYVILFPQLLIVVHFKEHCNTYGSLFAYVIGLVIRLVGGEPLIHLPPLVKYPWYDEKEQIQLFPFRTMAMLISMFSLLAVSLFMRCAFVTKKWIPLKYDLFRCFDQPAVSTLDPDETMELQDPNAPPKPKYTEEQQPRPIRKPDPSLRELQRQISFGSGSGGFGSIRKKMTAQPSTESRDHPHPPIPPPVVEESVSAVENQNGGGGGDEHSK